MMEGVKERKVCCVCVFWMAVIDECCKGKGERGKDLLGEFFSFLFFLFNSFLTAERGKN